MTSIGSQKHLFEIPEDVTYLNCAYMSPQLRAVTEAGTSGVRRKAEPWKVRANDFFDEVEVARELFARLISADGEGVALIPSVSYATATAAANVALTTGDKIVLLAEQFPSNVYIWYSAAERAGAEVVTVPRSLDGDWTGAVRDAIDERVKVVAVPNCHWTDGSVLDISEVGRLARNVGATFVIDATQSLGAFPLDVQEVQPDFLIAAGYKWLLGPYSLGYTWVAPRWRDAQPIEQSWMTREASVDFARLVDYRDDYRSGARRFDVGETANFALMPMAIAALRQILEWEVENIAGSLRGLTDRLAEEAAAIGLGVPPASARAPHMLGLTVPGGAPRDLPERLAADGIYVSVRGDSIRVAPHLYNDEDDVKRLIEHLSSL
jgi:selenocysteine lyase/cysteine desulfurase